MKNILITKRSVAFVSFCFSFPIVLVVNQIAPINPRLVHAKSAIFSTERVSIDYHFLVITTKLQWIHRAIHQSHNDVIPRYHLDRSGTGPAVVSGLRYLELHQLLRCSCIMVSCESLAIHRASVMDDIINRIATKSRSKNWFHFREIFSIQDYSFLFLGHIGHGTTSRLNSASIMVRIMRRNNSYCTYDCVCWLDTSCSDIGVGGFVIITIRSTMHRVKCQAATFIAMYTEWIKGEVQEVYMKCRYIPLKGWIFFEFTLRVNRILINFSFVEFFLIVIIVSINIIFYHILLRYII